MNKRAEYQRRYRLRHPEVKRKWEAENRERIRGYFKKRYLRDKAKDKARDKLYKHMIRGKITRPDHCSACGLVCKPEAHHKDYSKALEVTWLCKMCHGKEHRKWAY